jgi:hypothetical protein
MARYLTAANKNLLYWSGQLVSAWPFTCAVQVKYTGSVAGSPVASCVFKLATTNIAEMYLDTAAKASNYTQMNTTNNPKSTAAVTADVWQSMVGQFKNGDFRILLNTTEATSNTVSTLTAPDQVYVGANNYSSAISAYWNGALAEVAWWNVELTTQEKLAFSAGFSPLLIRQASLAAYWPLGGGSGNVDTDRSANGRNLTPSSQLGSPVLPTWVADHPKTIYPCDAQCC